jgi:hypothetical protein
LIDDVGGNTLATAPSSTTEVASLMMPSPKTKLFKTMDRLADTCIRREIDIALIEVAQRRDHDKSSFRSQSDIHKRDEVNMCIVLILHDST